MTRHVVLLTYGEPPDPGFFPQLRYSWRILIGLTRSVAPIPYPLLPLIAVSRARFRWRLWTRECYRSPLEAITQAQAGGLSVALAARSPEVSWRVHVAYEFRDPLLTTVLDSIPAGEPVDILPMYAADSAFTHDIARGTLQDYARRNSAKRAAAARVLPPLDESRFAEISARHVLREIEARRIGGPEWALILTAHGTLLDPPRPMETGKGATECMREGIASRLAGRFGTIAVGWLNHTRGGRWTEPPVEESLRNLAEQGYRRVVYYPFGFSADNAESELEGRIALRAGSWLETVHLPCLNTGSEFLETLATHVIEASGSSAGAQPRGAGGVPAGVGRAALE